MRNKRKLINIPIKRRWYQKEFMDAMVDKKRAILVYHRRAGKDISCWTYLIQQAFIRRGIYYYIFPEYSQARKAFWDAITEDGRSYLDFIPRELLDKKWNNEMKLRLTSGSIIQVVGSDNYDAIRGTNPVGVVLSEYAYQNPNVWRLVLDSILEKNGGWAVFNSTPQGKNHFHELYQYAVESEDWYCKRLTIEDTKLIDPKSLEKKVGEGISEEFIQQEYYCSFDIGVEGSYYGRYVRKMQLEGRICNVPYDENLLVYTAFDLGFSDSTSILFFQKRGNEILIIDYYENRGYTLAHYIELLKSKSYDYGKHFIPHDGKNHNNTGTTFQQAAQEKGIEMEVLPREKSIMEGIERVRGILPRVCIDKTKGEFLIKCLLQYHADFNEKDHIFKNAPRHDWSSHACDTLRYMSRVINEVGASPSMSVEEWKERKAKHSGYKRKDLDSFFSPGW